MTIFENDSVANLMKDMCGTIIKGASDPGVVVVSEPRGQKCYALNGRASITLTDIYNTVFSSEKRNTSIDYLMHELYLYFKGTNCAKEFGEAASIWKRLVNPDGKTINSAYGNLIFTDRNEHGYTEFGWAINSLIKDKDTRQSVFRFNKPKHSFDANKDFVCTLQGIFDITDNKLNLTIYRRSQDLHTGLPYDIAWECVLLQQAHMILSKIYPMLEVGKFELIVQNLHIYAKDLELYSDIVLNDIPLKSHTLTCTEKLIDWEGNVLAKDFSRDTIANTIILDK